MFDPDALSPIFSEEYQKTPETVVALLRKEDPVHFIAPLNAWVVLTHEFVKKVFTTPDMFTSDNRVYENYQEPSTDLQARMANRHPLEEGPGGHAKDRALVASALAPKASKALEPLVREVIEEFTVGLRGKKGVVDLAREFTDVIPNAVVSRFVGIDDRGQGDAEHYRKMSREALARITPTLTDEGRIAVEASFEELMNRVRAVAKKRRDDPKDDLISALVRDNDIDNSDTFDLIVTWTASLISGGTETVAMGTKFGLRALFRNPDVWAELRADKSLVPNAIQEFLRYDFGGGMLPKFAKRDIELGGKQIKKGQLVFVSFMGAHRDPAVFPNPDKLDVRRDTSNILNFGLGRTACLGQHLARIELVCIFEALLDLLPPSAKLLEDQISWSNWGPFSRMESFPIDFG